MVQESGVDELKQEMAREHWKYRRELVDKSMDYTIQFGHAAIKAPGVVNMAAFAAFLGFLSANTDKLKEVPLVSVQECFVWFVLGVVSSALATGASYFTQYCYTLAENSYETSWERPYIEERQHWSKQFSIVFHILTVILVVLSYFALIYGASFMFELTKAVLILEEN